jgi:hypothetical protein
VLAAVQNGAVQVALSEIGTVVFQRTKIIQLTKTPNGHKKFINKKLFRVLFFFWILSGMFR